MAKTVYGLGAFQGVDYRNQISKLEDRIAKLELELITARVTAIDQNTGRISCQILSDEPINNSTSSPDATSFTPHLKNYPLIGEIVLLIKSVSPSYQDSVRSYSYYYISPLNLWNEPNTNPLFFNNLTTEEVVDDKTYQESELGSSQKSSTTPPPNTKPGTYFIEKGNILPLYSFEGDIIFEGRWGNTIRLGSTNTNSPIKSPWSNLSKFNGDPITIIDNTRSNTSIESFSNDSSIWLTSTQKLPITGSSIDYTSYTQNPTPPEALNQYSNRPQIVLNSGRLVFNTTQDHLILSSKKTINLNSVEGVNVDTRGNFVIQAPQVYLGDSEDNLTQPVVLGDDLVSLLNDILTDLNTLTRSLQNQVGVPVGTPLAPTSLTAQLVADKIPSYKRRVGQLLSNTTRTAV